MIVHLPIVEPTVAGIVPPAILTEPAPGTAVITPRLQVVEVFGTAATFIPTGKVSVRFAPESAVKFGLKSVMVKVEGEPCFTLVGKNDLLTSAGAAWAELVSPSTRKITAIS